MHQLPLRESVVQQVVKILRKGIHADLWGRQLPGELELCRKFQVSRSTLRAALDILTKEKLIATSQGRRRRVLKPVSGRAAKVVKTVKLLTAVALERLGGVVMLLVDDLRAQLAKDRLELEVHVSPACFGPKPDRALEKLAGEEPPAVWVLLSAPKATQRWFMRQGLSCVLLGSQHPGIALPALDTDLSAMGQHAARQFLARGHRRLAVLIPEITKAGDANMVAAFRAVCEQTPGASLVIIEHDGTPGGIQRRLSATLRKSWPTGLLVAHARHVLTAMSFFAGQGIRAPRDISVIARDHEPFLDFVVPPLAHYVVAPATFARKLSRLVLKMARGESVPARGLLLMPSFVPGETLAYLSAKQTSGR
jgi:hypothetical protein